MPRKQSTMPQRNSPPSPPVHVSSGRPGLFDSLAQGASLGLGSSFGHSIGHMIFGPRQHQDHQEPTNNTCIAIKDMIKECQANGEMNCDYLYKKLAECQKIV